MSTPRVVPAFDEVEDGAARVGLGAEAFAIEQLALERREEALAHGVVVGIAHTAHRRPDAGLATAPAEGERRVLAALIRVMNHLGRSALRDGHVERGQDELGAERSEEHTSELQSPCNLVCRLLLEKKKHEY